jgi:5-methylcytosine-specific restriction protein A
MKKEENYGILASIDWNSNKWQDNPTSEDLSQSKFGNVIKTGKTFTSLNFGHKKFPAIDGYYPALLPQLWKKTPDKEKSKKVIIIFIKSYNWHDKQNYLIGYYAFPIFKRESINSPLDSTLMDINIRSQVKDIYLLNNSINLSKHIDLNKFLPFGKDLGKQGYNYLIKDNVLKIMDTIRKVNPNVIEIEGVMLRILKFLK